MRQRPLPCLELDTHANDTVAGAGACPAHYEEISVMLPFLNFGGIGLFGIFFVINLIIQLLTGGLADLFPTTTM